MKAAVARMLAACLLSGCSAESYLQNRKLMETGTSAVITADRGLVFGERCGGGGFNIGSPTDPSLELVPGWTKDGRYFFMSLPAGTYNISAIGSVDGKFDGAPPLEFTVVPQKAIYVGAVYPSWWRAGDGQEKCQLEWRSAVKARIYEFPGLLGFGKRRWEVYVLNKPEAAVQALSKEYPAVDLSTYSTQLVR